MIKFFIFIFQQNEKGEKLKLDEDITKFQKKKF